MECSRHTEGSLDKCPLTLTLDDLAGTRAARTLAPGILGIGLSFTS